MSVSAGSGPSHKIIILSLLIRCKDVVFSRQPVSLTSALKQNVCEAL